MPDRRQVTAGALHPGQRVLIVTAFRGDPGATMCSHAPYLGSHPARDTPKSRGIQPRHPVGTHTATMTFPYQARPHLR
jgi:hypothetical protein